MGTFDGHLRWWGPFKSLDRHRIRDLGVEGVCNAMARTRGSKASIEGVWHLRGGTFQGYRCQPAVAMAGSSMNLPTARSAREMVSDSSPTGAT
jgi:hypothetical protein